MLPLQKKEVKLQKGITIIMKQIRDNLLRIYTKLHVSHK